MRRGSDGDAARLCDVEMDYVVHETANAVCFKHDADEVWLPRSVIEYERQGKGWVVTMPEDLAIRKGLV